MQRTFLSLVAGLLSGTLFITAGGAGLRLLHPAPEGAIASGLVPEAEWIILELLVIFLGGVVGGYVTAAIARSSGLRHALMLGALVALGGTIALAMAPAAQPLFWYHLGAIGAVVPAAAMGGAMRAERGRRSGRVGGAAARTA